MEALITVLPGDGIGPEVCSAGQAVLEAIAQKYGHQFEYSEQLIGGAAIDAVGDPFPAAAEASCKDSHAVMLGAVGGPKWSDPNAPIRPEQGLLALRASLEVFANIRPVEILPELAEASPIKADRLDGVDIIVVRELTGGIYFGDKERTADFASDLCIYRRHEVERIIRVAAELARNRRKRLTSVDKANVLETSRFWRDVTLGVLESGYAELETDHILVDAAAMHLISRPADFDVIVTENMFGDILTDEASMLAGSMGMLPSASLGETARGLYEPIHGSAPDIAGQGIANPCGMIASVALLLRHSLNLDDEAADVESAIRSAIRDGVRTVDIAGPGGKGVSTADMQAAIIQRLR